ncbi:MAG: hemin uptake protein HemP [Hyphomicrobiaceae bacterium]
MTSNRGSSATPCPAAGGESQIRRIQTSELFGSSREVILVHEGQCYRLRITSSGKLILTK